MKICLNKLSDFSQHYLLVKVFCWICEIQSFAFWFVHWIKETAWHVFKQLRCWRSTVSLAMPCQRDIIFVWLSNICTRTLLRGPYRDALNIGGLQIRYWLRRKFRIWTGRAVKSCKRETHQQVHKM